MATVMGERTSRSATITQDDDDFEEFSEDAVMSDAPVEKDATEEELERLVFGDAAGFKEEIAGFQLRSQFENGDNLRGEEDEDENNLTHIDSADLFFLDAGTSKPHDGALATTTDDDDNNNLIRRDPPAWQDSDDERLQVSLMAVPRLRKLRRFEGEDVISGREYVRRLRKQFELLHPRPQWADWTAARIPSKKRRRSSAGSDDSEGHAVDEDDNDEDEDFSVQPLAKLLRSSESFTRTAQTLPNKRIKLQPQTISIERMKDISPTQPSAITSLSIHPTLPLLLSSGISSTLYLHHLHPHPTPPDPANPLITSLHLKHTPLSTTAFSSSLNLNPSTTTTTPKIYLSSRRRYFHIWDLPTGEIRKITRIYGHQSTQRSMEILKPSPCGRYIALQGTTRKNGSGVINILDANTTQWIAQARIESRKGLADFAWWGDGRGLCIVGKGGEVSEWSVEEQRIIERWQDEGAVGTTTLALGGHPTNARKKNAPPPRLGPDRWIAIGSTSGIVNIYDRSLWLTPGKPPSANPVPTKALDNLTTPVSHLAFSPCGQVLVMASRWKRDALRLVHLPSCSVYRNWPTGKTPLGRISAVALGEYQRGGRGGSGSAGGTGGGEKIMVLAVGNEAGITRAWEITG